MKVFMSWSGDRSREVAKLLDFWIKCVVQASRPWISTSGIDAGSIWFHQINNELQDTTFGIICLTKENKDARWILFEAGALAKGLATSRVCTFLIDLDTGDIRDPLAQFNHTLPTVESMWKLVTTINASLPEASRLDVGILKSVFDTYWPKFKEQFDEILKTYPENTVVPPREDKDVLAEILEATRNMSQRVRALEERGNLGAHLSGRFIPTSAAQFAGGGISTRLSEQTEEMLFTESVNIARRYLQRGLSPAGILKRLQEHGYTTQGAQEVLGAATLGGAGPDSDSAGS